MLKTIISRITGAATQCSKYAATKKIFSNIFVCAVYLGVLFNMMP